VLPMTVLSGGESVAARRHVDFNFSPYSQPETREVMLSDRYELTNTGSESVTVSLAYPFEGSLLEAKPYIPAISVNAGAAETSLIASPASVAPLGAAGGWEDYRTMMEKQDFPADALALPPRWEEPVILYKIACMPCEAADTADYPYLQIGFTAEPESILWTYRLGSGENYLTLNYPTAGSPWDTGTGYLLVQGGGITFTGIQGHHSSYPGKDSNRLEGMDVEITTMETTFAQALILLAEDFSAAPQYDRQLQDSPYNTPEVLTAGAMKRLTTEGYHTQATAYRILDSLFASVLSDRGILYQTFSVTLAPGETAEIEASYRLRPSRDFSGIRQATDGYAMATRLGSDLTVTSQSASVSASEYIQIVEQNFGFDLENGIVDVGLDMEEAYYYLRVNPAG